VRQFQRTLFGGGVAGGGETGKKDGQALHEWGWAKHRGGEKKFPPDYFRGPAREEWEKWRIRKGASHLGYIYSKK